MTQNCEGKSFTHQLRETKEFSKNVKMLVAASAVAMEALQSANSAFDNLAEMIAKVTSNTDFDEHLRHAAGSMQRSMRAFRERGAYATLSNTLHDVVVDPSKRLRGTADIIVEVAKKRNVALGKKMKYEKKLLSYEHKNCKKGTTVMSSDHEKAAYKCELWSRTFEEQQASFTIEYESLVSRCNAELPRIYSSLLSSSAQFNLSLSSTLLSLSRGFQNEVNHQIDRFSWHNPKAASAPSCTQPGPHMITSEPSAPAVDALSLEQDQCNSSRCLSDASDRMAAHIASTTPVTTPIQGPEPPQSLSRHSSDVANPSQPSRRATPVGMVDSVGSASFSQQRQQDVSTPSEKTSVCFKAHVEEECHTEGDAEDPPPTRPTTRAQPCQTDKDPNKNPQSEADHNGALTTFMGGGGRLSDLAGETDPRGGIPMYQPVNKASGA